MPETSLPSGVKVAHPDFLEVAGPSPESGVRGDLRRPLPTGPISIGPAVADQTSADLLAALSDQGLRVLDQFDLRPRTEAAAQARRIPIPTEALGPQVAVEASVGADESAVVLTEHDGVYRWHLARAATGVGAPATRAAAPGQRVMRFDIELLEPAPQAAATRNWIVDLAVDGIRGWVLKFAAHATVGEAVEHLDGNSRTGFVFVNGTDPEEWGFQAEPGPLNLPTDRPGRVLLLIHGTFSSTVGGFGALTATPWGRQFLTAAGQAYDSILGYDHPTLRQTPLENATALLELLKRALPAGTQMDVITHSRGGLVFRSLSEILLPTSEWKPNIGRVVMVAVPNAGTFLAEPENWSTLVNLYTNIAVGACRLLKLMPHAAVAATILNQLIKSAGEFVKYLAEYAAGEGGVPGLDAMRPSGEFVKELNQTQAGQPGPGALSLYAVTSEFSPSLTGPDVEGSGLPRRVVLMCAGASLNQLMREANDLVVQTSSMTAVDEAAGRFVTDEFSFGATGKVYHTTYFIRPETVNALVRWLRLEEPHAKAVADVQGRTIRVAHADIPALVDTDVSLFDATDRSGRVLTAIQTFAPSYCVIRRQESGRVAHYAFLEEELISQLQDGDPERPLGDALNLKEAAESPVQTVGTAARVGGHPEATTARRAVVMVGDLPVGVVPAPSDFVPHAELPKLAKAISIERNVSTFGGAFRRIMPTFGIGRSLRGPQRTTLMYSGTSRDGNGTIVLEPARTVIVDLPASAPAPAAPTPETKVGLHFLAEMPGEVKATTACTVMVTVSREALQAAAEAASAMGTGDAVAARKLVVQVIPRAQFSIDEDRCTVDIPETGKPKSLFFDLTATHEGVGEIWVVIRQDQAPICTLVLQPKVVAATSGTQRRLHAESEADDAPFLSAPLHELRIMDVRNGPEVRYRFELYSPSLKLLKEFKSEDMKEDVQSFVNRLYKDIEGRWLSTKGDQADFAAEMRAIGSELFSKLFPPELQQILWEHRDEITSILAISTEPFIPWEVVLVKNPAAKGMGDSRFLAEMGLVRWLYEAGWPPNGLRIREGRARYVIPKYPLKEYVLVGAQQEATDLQQLFGAVSVTPQPSPVRDLLSEKSFDLLHFACHAGAEGDDVSKGRILLEGRIEQVGNEMKYIPATIDATVVGEYANMQEADGTRPVVVLNACQAGRGGYRLSSTGGFAQSFLKGGAGAFIGALWSVGDQPARTFTVEFYRQLLNKETVAKAATLARAKAKSAGDATWLAYVVYAHPNAVLSTS